MTAKELETSISAFALTLLSTEHKITPEIIIKKTTDAFNLMSAGAGKELDINLDRVLRDVQTKCSTHIENPTILEDPTNHIEWLSAKRSSTDWKFWSRYRRYLSEMKGLPPVVVSRLDEMSDLILSKLEDPERPNAWDTRGMVVGRVQSGKTGNYTGVICKAIDAGYKVIIVLSGMHKSLRSQTQVRIDEGVIGFDTLTSRSFENNNERIGVGKLVGEKLHTIHPLTSSADGGDFNKKFAQQVSPRFGNDPVILVVKKNKSVLENLRLWALSVESELDGEKKRVIRNIPMLVIDDEADSASVNTKDIPLDEEGAQLDDYDVSAINGKIRQLLSSFEKSAYVAYTATPFANIFIPSDGKTEQHGDDIFPRNFIINLPTPSNYVGPAEVFGIDADPALSIEASSPLPIIREVKDFEKAYPSKHKKDHEPEELPESLRQAIQAFILVGAARRAGGQMDEHNSMLVHVTRFIQVQNIVGEQIQSELSVIRRRLELGDGNSSKRILDELKNLWVTDFEPTTRKMQKYEPFNVTWDQVEAELINSISRIQIKILNGSAKDVLDYLEYKANGLNVIAVGGDKLSRGLTLEGLSVSYYLRPTKMYDTLMQMGRWFGYRPHYLDLCRLYTTPQLIAWYKHVTLASEELLAEFDNMAAVGGTPRDYGLRVRTHSEGLLITSLNKMRRGQDVPISYEGDLVELPHYYKDAERNNANYLVADEFIKNLGAPNDEKDYIWRNISGTTIADFINALSTHPFAIKANSQRLAAYIRSQIQHNELDDWTVLLVSNKSTDRKDTLGGLTVGMTLRSDQELKEDVYSLPKSHLISPSDEYKDFSEAEYERALAETKRKWANKEIKGKSEPVRPAGKVVRSIRSPKKGMLVIYPLDYSPTKANKPIIGFAVSFPQSPTATRISYRMNEVAMGIDDEE